ncbi:interleukin-15 [Heteronotia binoei]|uniref:interleukin-15 n=1 Tax=Heteronotia binoei TaxID=13085 RepID=UPI00292F594F|nr:interleukin-15 [Heteronotia binoei]XP_060103309.1 interleukin-15 [Heteronotia binoei]
MNSYLLSSSLNNKPTVTIFIICSYLLQVQTKHDVFLSAALADLKKIKTCSEIDASLYTAEMTDHSECKASVMNCFILEMEVIWYESKYASDKTFTNTVLKVLKNVRKHLQVENQSNRTSTCQKCETFGEKKCTEFLKRFEIFIKQFYKLEEKKQNS